jgi:hypothetical protein
MKNTMFLSLVTALPGRSMARSLSAFGMVFLCLQGAFAQAVAPGTNALLPNRQISSQPAKSVAARLADQNALFKEQFEDDMRASPESETAEETTAITQCWMTTLWQPALSKTPSIARIVRSSKPFLRTDFPSRIVHLARSPASRSG